MPAEALAEMPVAISPERAESKQFTAAEYCMAFASIYRSQRYEAADILGVEDEKKINPQYVGTIYDSPEKSMTVISKIEEVMNSGLCRDRVERFADLQPPGGVLHDREKVDFLSKLSAICFVGAASEYMLDKHRFLQRKSDKLLAKKRIVLAHEQLVQLADSEEGRSMGIDRRHLRFMANIMYGKEEEASRMPVIFEVGISAEIATKRGLERLAAQKEDDTEVRYSTAEEDMKGSDIVVTKNKAKLLIDVKSSDRSGASAEERFAYHTPIEKDFGEADTYRIKELYPAGIESIGVNFSINEEYAEELRKVLIEFDSLAS